ncbi:MAG: Fic family protein [Thermodesulfovibrionales bacterium]
MATKDFENSTSGRCIRTLRDYCAFVPNPLPPVFEYDSQTIKLLSDADRLLGELSGTGRVLKNPYLLISPYIRREAVSSSRIEGTQSSLSDLFFYEASEMKIIRQADVKEVFNYVQAMTNGIGLLEKLPVSTRLICELHKILMTDVRGGHGTPGELRRSQNWIGPPGCTLNEATYVPPPVEEMNQSLSDWEKYINSEAKEPILIQAALMHYQFEAIHPFIDGNGRIGRLLITFFLYQKGSLTQPLLYLSDFFEKFRDEYYRRLLAVSQKGDWKGWIDFFLRGVINMATDSLANAKRILELYGKYTNLINKTARVSEIVHKLLDEMFISPVVATSTLSKKWGVQFNSVKKGVMQMEKLGILQELTGKQRNKLYASKELLDILLK